MTADTNTAKKLHVAMVLDVYDYARNEGILSTKRFTELLRKQGHKVTIISTGEEGADKIALPAYYPPVAKTAGCLL